MKHGDGRPPPGKGRPPQPDPRAERQGRARKADQLARDTGIPRGWALQVVEGKLTLNEVLTRLARQDRVAQLERRHGLDRSLAALVADGQTPLDEVLRMVRRKAHLAANLGRSFLDEAAADGRLLVVHLHGQRVCTATVGAVDAYAVELRGDGAPAEPVHKLQLKLACPPGAGPAVGTAPEGRRVGAPIPRPQDRFHVSDRRLFDLLDAARPLRLVTLEGEALEGRLAWVARWEIGLAGPDGAEACIFRHALLRIEEV